MNKSKDITEIVKKIRSSSSRIYELHSEIEEMELFDIDCEFHRLVFSGTDGALEFSDKHETLSEFIQTAFSDKLEKSKNEFKEKSAYLHERTSELMKFLEEEEKEKTVTVTNITGESVTIKKKE